MSVLVIISLFLTSDLSLANVCRENPAAHIKTKKEAAEILKATQIQKITDNTSDFCKRNLALRYLDVKKLTPHNCDELTTEDLIQQAEKTALANGDAHGPWTPTLIPSEKTRKASLEYILERNDISLNEAEKAFADKTTEPTDFKIIAQNLAKTQDSVAKDFWQNAKDQSLKGMACAQVTLLELTSCKSALDHIEQRMTPRKVSITKMATGLPLVDLDNARDVLTSEKYHEGIRRVALTMSRHLKKENLNPSTNVHDDFLLAFESTGMSRQEAQDASLKVLGFISSGGANTFNRIAILEEKLLPRFPLSQNGLALSFIGSAMVYLDQKKAASTGKLYSYPKEVDASCDNAKPYHFWMSAYVSHELVKAGYSKEVAGKATYIAQKAYQTHREIGNPKLSPVENLFTKETYSPVLNVIRTDFANSAAGSIFGAEGPQTKKNLSVKNALIAMIREGEVMIPLSSQETKQLSKQSKLSSYRRFNDLFAPDAAFDILFKEQK